MLKIIVYVLYFDYSAHYGNAQAISISMIVHVFVSYLYYKASSNAFSI